MRITWTLFLLSEQPELQDEAAAEARAALAAGADDADLPERLPLLRRILEEIACASIRRCRASTARRSAADRLGEHEVGAGDIVSIWPWLLHRHRALWDDPDAFDRRPLPPRGEGGAPSLPVSPVRRRPAPVRRRPLRDDRGADRPRPLAERLAFAPISGPRGPALGDGHAAAGGRPAVDPGAASVLLPPDIDAGDLAAGGAVLDQGREAALARLRLLRAGDPVEHDLAVAGRPLLPIGPGRLVRA